MDRTVVANIVGCAMGAIGIFLYAHGIVVDKKIGNWKTFVGFGLAALGGLAVLIIDGKL